MAPMEWLLLEGVSAEEVRELLAVARRRRFRRGEVVFHREDPADSMHLISKGRFAVRNTTPLGDSVMVAVRGPGESFGEMALVDAGSRRTATVEALEEAETFSVYHADFTRLRHRHASIDEVLLSFLVHEVRMLNERLLEVLYVPADRRVLRRLADLAAFYARGVGPVDVPLTQTDLASLAGTSRSTVNKVLRNEERRRTLELHHGRTRVLEPEELARRAR
jgi:CRP-like cAMP-binding protein